MYISGGKQDTNRQKAKSVLTVQGQVDMMNDGQKKIWICLLIVVLAAVVIGILYYFSTPTEHSSEGFLIRAAHGQCEAATSEEAGRRVILLSEEDNNGI